MRDNLPTNGPLTIESAIVNLDSSYGTGTHWVCYRKMTNTVYYFDSFGNLRPPPEIVRYFGNEVIIKYNYKRKQTFDSVICGHLCLEFLNKSNNVFT